MAINLYKDEDPSKKVGTGGNSVAPLSSGSAPVSTPKDPVPVGGKADSKDSIPEKTAGLKIEDGPKADPNADTKTVEDIYAALCTKIRNGETLSPEEQKLYDEMSDGYKVAEKKDVTKASEDNTDSQTTKAESEADKVHKEEVKKKYGEYKVLENKGGTEYEKTSRILNKYLSENDESYKNLQEKLANAKDSKQKAEIEKQLREKRDKLIHDWQAIVNPNIDNKSLSLKDRQRGIHEIGKIFSLAGASGKSLEEFKNSKTLEIIKKYESNKFLDTISQPDFSQAKTADDKINLFVDKILQMDSQYTKLQGKEKEEYRVKVICTKISDQLGVKITPEMYNSGRAKILKEIIVGMVSESQKANKLDIDILNDKNQKLLAKRILNYIDQQSDFINSLDVSEQKDLEKFKARVSIVATLNKDTKNEKIKEKDIYKYLKDNEKNLNTAQKELYAEYKHMRDIGISLDTDYDMKNAMSLSIMFGIPIDGKDNSIEKMAMDYMKDGINSANPKERESRLVTYLGLFVGSRRGSTIQANGIAEFQKCANMSDAQLENILSREDMQKLLGRQHAHAYAIGKESGNWSEYGTSLNNISRSKPNKELIGIMKSCSANMTKQDQIIAGKNKNYQSAITKNQDVRDAITSGMNSALSFAERQDVFKAYSSYGNDAFTGAMSESIIKTASKSEQVKLGKALLDIHNAAITEGVAAAEKHVDSSVREQYSKNLTNEINEGVKKGYYTQNDVQNFETARQTGQTSSERAQASENSTSASSSERTNQTSAQAQTSSASSIQGAKVRTETIYISSETKSYANTIKATLAQLDSENKKADAMKTIAESIAKIQANEIKYEAKVAQQKIQQQKQAVEAAKQENAKKSAEQLKAEQKAATESCVKEIQEELSQSAEAKEIQKYFSDPSWFEKLKSYAKDGQIDQVYQMLAKIPKAQDLFIEKLATKHISTITHFIKTADKSVIKHLVELNPSLISVLDRNLLLEINIPKATIIKYGDKDQIAGLLSDLQLASTKETLKEFYEVLGVKDSASEEADASEVVKKNASVKGDDDFISQLQRNMKNASRDYASSGMQGTVVPNWKEPDKKVPREMWG